MPAFLTNTSSDCCCPEMRCCAPQTVVATPGGWAGTSMSIWVQRIYGESAPAPLPQGYADLYIGPRSCAYEMNALGCQVEYELVWDGTKMVVSGDSIYLGCYDIVWPAIAFPQMIPFTDYQFENCPPGQTAASGLEGQVYVTGFNADAAFAAKCTEPETELLCEAPPGGVDSIVYGPAGGHSQHPGRRTWLNDYNSSYVCHRIKGDMRPEFVATVNRSTPATQADIEARIVFDVYCRRNWEFSVACNDYIVPSLSCAVSDDPPENPPAGSWFCIDYRCGPRFPDASTGSVTICEQHKCTAQDGTVWPHLIPISLTQNYTATLKLELVPGANWTPGANYGLVGPDTYQAAKGAQAVWWRVGGVEIIAKGTGYEVGESFEVDFDPFWIQQLTGREINVGFPDFDAGCASPLVWRDKYGEPPAVDGLGVKRYFQRLRVMKVDDDGGIEELEIVPWFQDPEFVPGSCSPITNQAAKTKHYPGYMRVICHPNSVDIGGTGYEIGDSITFTPLSPAVETHAPAVATVVDVDDDGAVLDWRVNGSDIYYYGYGAGNQNCYLLSADERGAYRWPDKTDLCYLHWEGVGVPVRQTDLVAAAGFFVNTGGLTQTSVTVSRVPCRTAISVVVDSYRYQQLGFLSEADSPEGAQQYRLLKKYPPYPKCPGGGAQIFPILGDDGGNESAIGGPLVGGEVKSGGGYYAFADVEHVAPTLPTAIPDIEDGSGAMIGAFTFGEVLNFPQPDYADGEKREPPARRFAYFPVTAASIANGGAGYLVGQEFDVAPVAGVQWSHPWRNSGGDNPDRVANGAWYQAQNLTASGHVPIETTVNGVVTIDENFNHQPSLCRLRVSEVDEDGAITELEVLHGGLMFRPTWSSGVRHPDVYVVVGSDTGDGAKATVAINTTRTSPTFGEVTGCTIVSIPVEDRADPLHSTPGNPVAFPLGGRDYANPASGMMWELQNMQIGSTFGGAPASLLSYVPWHGWVYDAYHEENSTHDLIQGSHPPFHRRAEHCTLAECYHPLLNKTYPMYRLWTGMAVNGPYGQGGAPGPAGTPALVESTNLCDAGQGINSLSPLPSGGQFVNGNPKGAYGLYRLKGKVSTVYAPGPEGVECDTFNYEQWRQPFNGPTAQVGDYVVIEHGYTVSLSAVIPVYPNCPDHDDGRVLP
jgi:hypothetical protein